MYSCFSTHLSQYYSITFSFFFLGMIWATVFFVAFDSPQEILNGTFSAWICCFLGLILGNYYILYGTDLTKELNECLYPSDYVPKNIQMLICGASILSYFLFHLRNTANKNIIAIIICTRYKSTRCFLEAVVHTKLGRIFNIYLRCEIALS